ncbi:MAG TPA: hypothetical protein VF575_02165 [Candidatus Saccharimonadales bacterium]
MNFRKAPHMLEQTELIHSKLHDLGLPTSPIDYFEIPSRAHSVGKLVVPFVHLLDTGEIDAGLPPIYGVTSQPNAHTKRSSVLRSQEAHVFAEDLALRRGIFTPYARGSSEVIATKLIPKAYLPQYVSDRVAHLGALIVEVDETRNLTKKQRAFVIKEIGSAKGMLEDK